MDGTPRKRTTQDRPPLGPACELAETGDYNIATGLVRWCFTHRTRHTDTAGHPR